MIHKQIYLAKFNKVRISQDHSNFKSKNIISTVNNPINDGNNKSLNRISFLGILILSLDLSFFKYLSDLSSSFYALQSYKFTHKLDRFYDEPIKEALSKVTLDQLLDEDSQIFLNDTIREIIKEVGIEEYKNQTHRLPIHREKDKYLYPLYSDWTRYLLVLAVSILLGDVSIDSIGMINRPLLVVWFRWQPYEE